MNYTRTRQRAFLPVLVVLNSMVASLTAVSRNTEKQYAKKTSKKIQHSSYYIYETKK